MQIASDMAAQANSKSSPSFARGALIAILVLALSAALICAYLLLLKLTGKISSIAGCGQVGGCSDLLGGRWSVWFGLPVSLGGLITYAALAVFAFREMRATREASRLGLLALSLLAVFAGLWFFGLQAKERSFCPWCTAIHVSGLSIFGIVALQLIRLRREGEELGFMRLGIVSALGLGIVLASGQILSRAPQSMEVTEIPSGTSPPKHRTEGKPPTAPAPETQVPAGGRVLTLMNGEAVFDVDRWPIVGSPTAKHILVEYFDYTCANCARLHEQFHALKQQRHLNDVALLYVPMPLNRQCTPSLKPGVDDHANACEYAKFSLAVWEADRKKWESYHETLFTFRDSMSPALAQQKAIELVGQEKFQRELESPWVKQVLSENSKRYDVVTRPRPDGRPNIAMPKLLLGGVRVMGGTPPSAEDLMKVLREQLKLP